MRVVSNNWFDSVLLSILHVCKPSTDVQNPFLGTPLLPSGEEEGTRASPCEDCAAAEASRGENNSDSIVLNIMCVYINK